MPAPAHPAAGRIVDLYENNAACWDSQRNRYLMERPWLDRFTGLMRPGASVLDIGCGTGEPIATHLIARDFVVTGVDSSSAMIGMCCQRFPGSTWLVADMRSLALGRRFNGLLAWNSFFHLPAGDQRAMFRTFREHAEPQAALMFTSGPKSGEAIGNWQGEQLYHASLDPEDYCQLLDAEGFQVVDHVPEDPDCGRHTVWLAQAS